MSPTTLASWITPRKPNLRGAGFPPAKNLHFQRPGIEALEDRNLMDASNLPWFPSLMSFEHYDSVRSHLFEQASYNGSFVGNNLEADFNGSFTGSNLVTTRTSSTTYPTGYNMVYLNPDDVFLYGGCYGNIENATGSFVTKIDPKTLEPIWSTQLTNTAESGEWNYPGVVSILQDGYLYLIYGYHLAKLDPRDGTVIAQVELPTGGGLPENTSFNGFDALEDGTLIAKTVYRQEGCTEQGPTGLFFCPDPGDVPSSIMVSINPQTLSIIDQVTLPTIVGGRPTTARFQSQDYVYFATQTSAIRYQIENGVFTLDDSWNPGAIYQSGQTLGSAVVVMNDWFVVQSNGSPATTPMSVILINQGDASLQYSKQPFVNFPVPEGYPTSWSPFSVSVDPERNLIYTADSSPGAMGALELTSEGLQTLWTVKQRTTEFMTLVGDKDHRVLVGTQIPVGQIPNSNTEDFVVWRNALTGDLLARTEGMLPAMTSGTMIQPYYYGKYFYMGLQGALIELTVQPTPPTLPANTQPVVSAAGTRTTILQTDRTLRDIASGFSEGSKVHLAVTDSTNTYRVAATADPGGNPVVKIMDLSTGQPMGEIQVFDPAFRGGVFLDAADIDGDGVDEFLVGAGPGGGPHVKLLRANGTEMLSFFAFDPVFRGGTTVAFVDVDNNGSKELVVGAGPGGGPHVKIFNTHGDQLRSYFAFDPNFTGGVFVAAGDLGGDGPTEIVVAAGSGGTPHVRIFNSATLEIQSEFLAYDAAFRGGVRVAIQDYNQDGILDLIVGAGPGGGPHVKIYDEGTLTTLEEFFAADEFFRDGVFV